MMNKISIQSVLTVALILFSALTVHAQETAGKVIMSRGDVQAVNLDGEVRKLKRRDSVFSNEIIKTGDKSKVQIRFVDNALLALKANSELNIKSYIFDQAENSNNQVLLELVAGGFRTLTGQIGKGNKAAYKVDTPVASIGIRGTLYDVQVSFDKIYAGVWKGGISLDTQQGQFDLGFGANFDFAEVGANGDFTGLLTPPEVFAPPSSSQQDQQEGEGGENGEDKQSPEQGDFQQDEQGNEKPQQPGDNRNPDLSGSKAPNSFEKDTAPVPEDEDDLAGLPFDARERDDDNGDGTDVPIDPSLTQPDEDYSPDARLTPKEYTQLANSPDLALVISEDGFALAVSLNEDGQTDGSQFFVNTVTSADGTSAGIETLRQGSATLATLVNNDGSVAIPWSDQVSWGVWDASADNPAERYSEFDNNQDFTPVTEDLFFLNISPASAAELSGGLAAGSYQFTMAQTALPAGTTDFVASASNGMVTEVDGSFDFDVANNQLMFNGGFLYIEVDTDGANGADRAWGLDMLNGEFSGALLNADLDGYVGDVDNDPDSTATGSFGGLFLAPANGVTEITEFAGGFQVESINGVETAGGIIIMQGGEIIPQ